MRNCAMPRRTLAVGGRPEPVGWVVCGFCDACEREWDDRQVARSGACEGARRRHSVAGCCNAPPLQGAATIYGYDIARSRFSLYNATLVLVSDCTPMACPPVTLVSGADATSVRAGAAVAWRA